MSRTAILSSTILFCSLFLMPSHVNAQTHISEFVSITPQAQGTDFPLPSTHVFQAIITKGDALTEGGVLPPRADFTGYVPIAGSSVNGYLSVSSESSPGGVSIMDIQFNSQSKLWEISKSQAVDFSSVGGTARNCSGTVTPWNTIITCEETTAGDGNSDGYKDLGWCVEVDPALKQVVDKRWALGNFNHENVAIDQNLRTVYEGADESTGFLYKFVADVAEDLSSGKLYVYQGSKAGAGNWILLNNTTQEERNTTKAQAINAGGTVFNGVEDVEIGPDGWVYFAVKNESQVYRFQDSDKLTGTTVPVMETFVGNQSYEVNDGNSVYTEDWGVGNDNLTFDNLGNLWVMQDGGVNNVWLVEPTHTQANPQLRLFAQSPIGGECTGMTFSPDNKFMFMSVQNPTATNNATTQMDAAGNSIAFDKDAVLVIALKENLGVLDAITVNEKPSFELFPNPTTGLLTIANIPNTSNIQLQVQNMLGKQMTTTWVKNTQGIVVDLTSIPHGIYLLTVEDENNQKQVFRVVKQ